MRLMHDGMDNRNQFQVNQLAGGIKLFPYHNDDRFQVEFGGTYNAIKDTSLANKLLYSRITFRLKKSFWFRLGYESKNGYTTKQPSSFQDANKNAGYFAGRFAIHKLYLIAFLGRGKIYDSNNTRYGFAGLVKGPLNI